MYPNNTAYQMGMNTYPIQGQPINQTQTGVPYDDIRQRIAQLIYNNICNIDAAGRSLYADCAGAYNNFQTGRMDTLVEMAAMIIDYDFFNRRNPDINVVVNDAIMEVCWQAWANQFLLDPRLNNDPTCAANIPKAKEWQDSMRRRLYELQQAGLLNNNPVMNVNAWQTNAGVMPGNNNFGYRPLNSNANMQMDANAFNQNGNQVQSQYRSNTGYQPMSNTSGYQPRQNTGYQPIGRGYQKPNNLPMMNPRVQAGGNQDNYSMGWNNPNNPAVARNGTDEVLIKSNGEAFYRGSDMSRLRQKRYYSETSNEPKQEPSRVELMTREGRERYGVSLDNVNIVPEKRSPFDQLRVKPTESTPTQSTMTFATPSHDTVKHDWVEQAPTIEESTQTVDMTDEVTLTKLFAEMQQEEVDLRTKGIREDEIKVVTAQEARQLVKSGTEIEPPYISLISGNPFEVCIHYVLTKANTIRQIVTRYGEPMRFDAHLDVLNPLRNDKVLKRDPNYGKTISARSDTYNTTTKGGVVYDRFKTSKIVLGQAINDIPDDISPEEKEEKIKEAFKLFNEQIDKDLEESRKPVVYTPENIVTDSEGNTRIEDDPEFQIGRVEIQPVESIMETVTTDDVALATGGVNDNQSAMLLSRLTDNAPSMNDKNILKTYDYTRVLKLFNNPEERAEAMKVLNEFFLEYLDSEEYKEAFADEAPFGSVDIHRILNKRFEKIPVEIWALLNDRATHAVNTYVKYCLGLDFYIESFAEDYLDALGLIQKQLAKKDQPKETVDFALMYLDITVLYAVQTLAKTAGISAMNENESIDVLEYRALCSREFYRECYIPTLSSALGLTDDETEITIDNNRTLFAFCSRMTLEQFNTYHRRFEGNSPQNALYISTLEGRRYRIYARITDTENRFVQDDYPRIADKFILVRVDHIA